ncbi:helix-turn-helix domain-containing protein [Pediococcus pentosaceus]|uniref:transposase n=1 Tax=Pediococcus pentosaceus TaxID=1255 RepID=UPI003F1EFCF7
MTKYSGEFKVKVIEEYQLGRSSYNTLGLKYQIHPSMIKKWVSLSEAQGLEALQVKHRHQEHSLDDKLAVVDYYQTHDMAMPNDWLVQISIF